MRMASNGDVAGVSDEASINQSLRTLINLEKWDKPFHPEISVGIRSLLFENWCDQLYRTVEEKIRRAVRRWEPRIDVVSVSAEGDPDENELIVTIKYRIRGEQAVVEFGTVLRRNR